MALIKIQYMKDTIIYSWIDDLGYHLYYCDINYNIDVLPIKNFNHNITIMDEYI
jgi:hypothetical protein